MLFFYHSLIFLVSSCTSISESKNTPNRNPNILLILVDDLGKEWISCYGAEDIQTPHIDALAASGTIFHNAYSMPQCTPTRITLLTGQYPFRHGWVNHWDVPRWGGGAHFDETMNPSLGIEMKKAGYRTCIAGKWQIDDFRVEPDALIRNGFDEYCMWTGYETGVPASGERYQNPYIFIKDGSKTYDRKFGPDVFRDFIIDFIKDYKNEPFFIYYPMVLTHTPFVDTPDESADNDLGKHKAMVKYADRITGKIVHALEEASVRDNTLIIWTTDNGTTGRVTGSYSGRKVKGGKMKSLESGIAAPFIVSWPDVVTANNESNALIDFTDMFPTFLDLAGAYPRKILTENGETYAIDGKSFKNVLVENAPHSNREWILSMGGGNHARLTENGVENQYKFRDRVLRNERYKLYVSSDRQPIKFFDLVVDPFEDRNLIGSLNSNELKRNFGELANFIESFPREDRDPKYKPNPAQDWDVEITAESYVWKK